MNRIYNGEEATLEVIEACLSEICEDVTMPAVAVWQAEGLANHRASKGVAILSVTGPLQANYIIPGSYRVLTWPAYAVFRAEDVVEVTDLRKNHEAYTDGAVAAIRVHTALEAPEEGE